MSYFNSYKLRLRRRSKIARAIWKRRELTSVCNRTSQIRPSDILVFSTLRNEAIRLPYFLDYYRNLGVNHFLIVDNGSTDGGKEYLEQQTDVSLWSTTASYRRSEFGVNWLNWLQLRYGQDHWCLVVDPDEFFVFPFCDTRPISALTDWLDACETRSFGAMLIDLYPKESLQSQPYQSGQNPLEIAQWFDSGNYIFEKNHEYRNLWIQGGPRLRTFFADNPWRAPALNKTPLIKWHWRYAYVSSTHMVLPRGLNATYDEHGGEKASGALLHTKFLDTFAQKAAEESKRNQHYANSKEYKTYQEKLTELESLWNEQSEKYINWRQLELLGLLSRGHWA